MSVRFTWNSSHSREKLIFIFHPCNAKESAEENRYCFGIYAECEQIQMFRQWKKICFVIHHLYKKHECTVKIIIINKLKKKIK